MAGIRTLAGDTMIYGASTILNRMLNYLLFPYLTYMLGPEPYGEIGDLYSIIPFALVLLTMGLESGYFRFVEKAGDEGGRRRLFATVWGATSFAAALFFIAVLLFNAPVAGVMGYADRPSFIWITALVVMLDVIAAIPFARLRAERRRMKYVGIRLASVVVNVLLCLFFFSLLPRLAEGGGFWSSLWSPSFGVGYVLVANVAASAASLLLLLPAVGRTWPCITPKIFRQVMIYSLPLLVSGVAGTAGEFIDRQFVKWLLPEDIWRAQLGIYTATTRLAAIMVLFTSMYRLAAEPFFLARFSKGDFVRQSAEAMKYYVMVAVAIFAGIVLFKDVVVLIAGPDFRSASHLLPLLLVAGALNGVVLNLSFWYKQEGRTGYAVLITGTGFVVITALCLLLIPSMGIEGAAWARLACEGAMVAVSLWLNQRFCPTPYDFRRIGLYVLLGGVLWVASLGTARLDPWAMYTLNTLIFAAFVGFAVWKEKLLKYVSR